MTTSTKNTKKHSTKGFAFAIAIVAALFGAGCAGMEGAEGGEEGGEEAVEMGQTQQAIRGAVNPDMAANVCKNNGRVYDASSGQCLGCIAGFTPQDDTGYKCVDLEKKCLAAGGTYSQCAPCDSGYTGTQTCPKQTPACTATTVNIADACAHSFPGSEPAFDQCKVEQWDGSYVYKTPSWGCASSCTVCYGKKLF